MRTPTEILNDKKVDLSSNIKDALTDIGQYLEEHFEGKPLTLDFRQIKGFDNEHWSEILEAVLTQMLTHDWVVTYETERKPDGKIVLLIRPDAKYFIESNRITLPKLSN